MNIILPKLEPFFDSLGGLHLSQAQHTLPYLQQWVWVSLSAALQLLSQSVSPPEFTDWLFNPFLDVFAWL